MLGFLFYSIGSVLLTVRELMPFQLYTSVLFGNYVLVAGIFTLNFGIKRLFGIIERSKVHLIFYLMFCIVFYYFSAINDNVALRIILLSLTIVAVYSHSIVCFFIRARKDQKKYFYSIIYLFFIYVLINISRVIVASINYYYITDILTYKEDVIFHILGLLVLFILFIHIITVINKKLSDELSTKLIENEALISELDHLTKLDYLTGLHNRKSLEEKTHELVKKCTENKSTFQYVLIDLNSFKEINDKYGHPFGDQVLINFGAMLKNYSDLVYRYGGDEFIILFDDVRDDVEKMITQIAKESSKSIVEEKCIPGFSYGIYCWKEGQTYADMIREVDQAMYANKRVVIK